MKKQMRIYILNYEFQKLYFKYLDKKFSRINDEFEIQKNIICVFTWLKLWEKSVMCVYPPPSLRKNVKSFVEPNVFDIFIEKFVISILPNELLLKIKTFKLDPFDKFIEQY